MPFLHSYNGLQIRVTFFRTSCPRLPDIFVSSRIRQTYCFRAPKLSRNNFLFYLPASHSPIIYILSPFPTITFQLVFLDDNETNSQKDLSTPLNREPPNVAFRHGPPIDFDNEMHMQGEPIHHPRPLITSTLGPRKLLSIIPKVKI